MNFKKYSFLLIFAFAATFVTGSVASNATASALDYTQDQSSMHQWKSGQSVAYKVVLSQKQVLEIPGQGVQEQASSAKMDISLTSVGPRQFNLAVTDAEFVGSQSTPDAVVGLESSIELDANGRITSATGLEENTYVKAQGGAASFIADVQELFLVLPDEPLAEGVSWTEETTFEFNQSGLSGSRSSSEQYKCKQLTSYNGVAAFEIEVTSDLSTIGSGNQGGGEMEFNLEGMMTGRIYVDASTGSLLNSEYSGTIEGGIDMAMGFIPMSIDIERATSVAE